LEWAISSAVEQGLYTAKVAGSIPASPTIFKLESFIHSSMKLTSSVLVPQHVTEVWAFLADPQNTPKWDRSIAQVIPISPFPPGVGYEAETVAPSGMRQRFRFTEFEPNDRIAFVLLRSRIFKTAELRFTVFPAKEQGTQIIHDIEVRFWPWSLLLYPVFLVTAGKALATDLGFLKRALAAVK
jgi:hypothetical protein